MQPDEPSHASAVLAFDVGGTTIKAEVLSPELDVWAVRHVPTPRGPAVVEAIGDLGEAMLAELPVDLRSQVTGAGVAVPGIVDLEAGASVYAANLGLRDLPLVEPLARRWAVPVALGHDVTVAAEAERRRGAAAGVVDPFVVVIGTGIAAVSYVHGRRVQGVSGQAGELGHVVVRPGGPTCGCGARGCLEAVASASAVCRAYRDAGGGDVTGAVDVVARLGTDDLADQVWAEATSALGDALLGVAALLAPGAVVLGGGLSEAGSRLLDPVVERMATGSVAVSAPPLRLAALGSRAGVVGAALAAQDRVVVA
jgi:glucokinase